MIGEIPRRIVDHSDSDGTKLTSPPDCHPCFALMLFGWDRWPISNAKRKILDVHVLCAVAVVVCPMSSLPARGIVVQPPATEKRETERRVSRLSVRMSHSR